MYAHNYSVTLQSTIYTGMHVRCCAPNAYTIGCSHRAYRCGVYSDLFIHIHVIHVGICFGFSVGFSSFKNVFIPFARNYITLDFQIPFALFGGHFFCVCACVPRFAVIYSTFLVDYLIYCNSLCFCCTIMALLYYVEMVDGIVRVFPS